MLERMSGGEWRYALANLPRVAAQQANRRQRCAYAALHMLHAGSARARTDAFRDRLTSCNRSAPGGSLQSASLWHAHVAGPQSVRLHGEHHDENA